MAWKRRMESLVSTVRFLKVCMKDLTEALEGQKMVMLPLTEDWKVEAASDVVSNRTAKLLQLFFGHEGGEVDGRRGGRYGHKGVRFGGGSGVFGREKNVLSQDKGGFGRGKSRFRGGLSYFGAALARVMEAEVSFVFVRAKREIESER